MSIKTKNKNFNEISYGYIQNVKSVDPRRYQKALENYFPQQIDREIDIAVYSISNLHNEGYQLNYPIPYSIRKIENEYVLDIQELEIYIITENIKEGVKELCEEIIFKYEQVMSLPDEKLGKFPRKWKSLLNSWIAKL